MGIVAWVIVGVLVGWVISRLTAPPRGQGWQEEILLGIVGAVVGGIAYPY